VTGPGHFIGCISVLISIGLMFNATLYHTPIQTGFIHTSFRFQLVVYTHFQYNAVSDIVSNSTYTLLGGSVPSLPSFHQHFSVPSFIPQVNSLLIITCI
jgi:hypothetical protein